MTLVKTAVKPVPSNGTTPTPPAPVKPVSLQKIDTEKKDLPPLEDRLLKLNQLFKKQADYLKLQDSMNKLDEFELNKEGERFELSIEDHNRHSFTTFNAEIIGDVVAFLKTKIKERIAAIEPQLMW